MLTKFSCKNFRSIGNDALTLDMVSSSKIRQHPEHICASSQKAKVLRNAAIYGANAAGKSTIVRAIDFAVMSITSGAIPQQATHEYCRAVEGLDEAESTFDVQFEVDGEFFDYGFSCIMKKLEVTSEWLYRLDNKPSLLFERNSADIKLGEDFKQACDEQDQTRFEIYREDFSAEAKRLPARFFFAAIGQGKRFDENSVFSDFHRAFSWFARRVCIFSPSNPSPTSYFYKDDKTLGDVAEVLSSFDTGISSLEKIPIDMSDLDKYIEAGMLLTIKDFMNQHSSASNRGHFAFTVRSGKSFIGITGDGTGESEATILKIKHKGSKSIFDFGEESDGTKRLFDFMDALFTESKDMLFVVDELDRSLHPMLTQQFIRLFNEAHVADDCQLILTTHENDIMSDDLFRFDEIWFVDRDEQGVSSLYSLNDFEEVRSDSRIAKQYLEGRYGGVPALSFGKALAALKAEEED